MPTIASVLDKSIIRKGTLLTRCLANVFILALVANCTHAAALADDPPQETLSGEALENYRRAQEAKREKAEKNVRPGEEINFLESYISNGSSPKRGEGSFERLVIRGVKIINGTGAPATGPVDIVIENERIAAIVPVGIPGLPIDERNRPSSGDRVIDGSGMYAMPGFINSHVHLPAVSGYGYDLDYTYKLWLAHGITTARILAAPGLRWTMDQANQIAKGEIEGPDLLPYPIFPGGGGLLGELTDEKAARQWVRSVAKAGAKGIKFVWGAPNLLRTAIDEAEKVGLQTTMHHAQTVTPRANVLDTARWGLGSMEHFWYGLPEALFENQTIQRYPAAHNYANELDRFRGAARIWAQAAPPYSPKWNAVMNELLELDFTISPTFAVKNATRNVMAAARQEWHDQYTMPSLWNFFTISRKNHGSFFFDWTSADEAAAAEDYRLGMTFINEYKNRGGRVVVGSDAAHVWNLYGFGFIKEMELLQEAGFSALEVIRAATMHGAEVMNIAEETGTLEVGKKADLVIVGENPLQNLKVLYGTGHLRLNDTDKLERVGGIEYTIKDGIVYNAKTLLADVREMVRAEKLEKNIPEGVLPIMGLEAVTSTNNK